MSKKYKDMSWTSVQEKDMPKINDFKNYGKTKISGMGGVQRRVKLYQDIINKENKGNKK